MENELLKIKNIQSSQNKEELIEAINNLSEDGIYLDGLNKKFLLSRTIMHLDNFLNNNNYPAETLTRNYGIRQQALYLKYYNEK